MTDRSNRILPFVLLSAALVLAGCGVKGPLEPPAGTAATAEIRKLPAPRNSIRIIAMTAHAMSGARQEYLEAGMDDYVAKPIKPELLLAKLADVAKALGITAPSKRAS